RFFFFQAEDGIRDFHVTGVQTCALPICHDPDVPSKPDDVNQEDREIPGTLPRVDFYHWALIDIPAGVSQIAEAAYSDGITPRGRSEERRVGEDGTGGWWRSHADKQGVAR